MGEISYALGVQDQDLLFFLSLLVACKMTVTFFLGKPLLILKKHFNSGLKSCGWLWWIKLFL